jgi:hypothetical protein
MQAFQMGAIPAGGLQNAGAEVPPTWDVSRKQNLFVLATAFKVVCYSIRTMKNNYAKLEK